MTVRKALFWLHLAMGVTAGIVIFTMSVTGVLLAFERQTVDAAERGFRVTPAAAHAPLSHLVAAASAARPNARATAVTLRSDAQAPATVSFGRDGSLLVDPYRGTVLGRGATGVRAFFRAIEDVHRWLAFGGRGRTAGRAVTGAANLLFFLIVLSGIVLWWPRGGSWRNALWFRARLRGRTRDFNWHNVIGIWSWLPLVAIVFSGVVMSYPWANGLVYRAFGSTPPQPREGPPRERGRDARTEDQVIDRLEAAGLAEIRRIAPDWRTITLRLPIAKRATFTIDRGNGARPDLRSQLVLDAASGRVVERETYTSQEGGRQARAWLRWIHTGEAGAVPGQVVAMLASAGAALLVWTGLSLALARLRNWRRRSVAL